MEEKYFIDNMKDILARVEGTIKVNEQGNPVRVHTKLQGIRDKLVHLVKRSEKESESQTIKEKIATAVGTNESH